MSTFPKWITGAILCTLCPALLAERSSTAVELTRKTQSTQDPVSTATSEVFRNLLIEAGKSMPLDSTLDYSTAGSVAVTILCTSCTTAALSLGSASLTFQARWLVPNAENYVATESQSAANFFYWDAGGIIFNVFGPQFRLTIQNKGIQAIVIQQITLFRRNQ